MYNEEKLYSVRSLVVVHILNFQRELVLMQFIHIELITCSTSEVDSVKVHIHIFHILIVREISLTFVHSNGHPIFLPWV